MLHWIALLPPEADAMAWGWRALGFTPRVARLDEAWVLEVSGSARLWGGIPRLLKRLLRARGLAPVLAFAEGATAFAALARLRAGAPLALPELPLSTLSAARPHVPLLERMGCRSWGDLQALPRGGLARRFGGELVEALDVASGFRPESHDWLLAPEVFDERLELPLLATSAPELLWAAQRLLTRLAAWLGARQQGVLALELEWTLDLKRLDGVALPQHEQLVLRTAQPTQDMRHLRRLASEQLARAKISAPTGWLRMRSLQTVPWAGASTSLLPEDRVEGERLHQLIERLSVRLGAERVLVPVPGDDHRPERMQRWMSARALLGQPLEAAAQPAPDALLPDWLLPQPVPLEVHAEQPCWRGPLERLTRLTRVETGWWDAKPAQRDYFVARCRDGALVWIYRERASRLHAEGATQSAYRWFLQGRYA